MPLSIFSTRLVVIPFAADRRLCVVVEVALEADGEAVMESRTTSDVSPFSIDLRLLGELMLGG